MKIHARKSIYRNTIKHRMFSVMTFLKASVVGESVKFLQSFWSLLAVNYVVNNAVSRSRACNTVINLSCRLSVMCRVSSGKGYCGLDWVGSKKFWFGFKNWPRTNSAFDKTSCRRAAATVCLAPLLPRWAPKRLPPPSRRQRISSFPRPTRSHSHHCSRMTRQHGGEQSGLVTLTFDLESCVRVTVTWATSVPILVFLGHSVLDLKPDVRDRQTDIRCQTDRCQTTSSLIMPRLGGGA